MPRQTLSESYIWAWTIHCGLPGTGCTCWNSIGLVSKVSVYHSMTLFLTAYLTITLSRCLAPPEKLGNGREDPRCREHTEYLISNFSVEVIWTTWGVDAMVIVRILTFPSTIIYINRCLTTSHSQPISPKLISTSWLCRISSINSSKEPSKII